MQVHTGSIICSIKCYSMLISMLAGTDIGIYFPLKHKISEIIKSTLRQQKHMYKQTLVYNQVRLHPQKGMTCKICGLKHSARQSRRRWLEMSQ
jgi:hypothetical protein